jgi:hypothetical protein
VATLDAPNTCAHDPHCMGALSLVDEVGRAEFPAATAQPFLSDQPQVTTDLVVCS